MNSSSYVTCLGLKCAVGLEPEGAAAAMRAGVSGLTALPTVGNANEPIMGGAVPSIAASLHGRERMVEMLVQVLQACSGRADGTFPLQRLPVLLCTAEPERPQARLAGLLPAVESRLGFSLAREGRRHLARGHVAVFEALDLAHQAICNGSSSACLVIAVDSMIDARNLLWLERAGRLKRGSRSDGVIPGEAAAVALVSKEPVSDSSLALRGVGAGQETATVLNDAPQWGEGMKCAVAAALRQAGIPMHEVAFRLSDASGEAYSFEDLALVQARLMSRTRECQALWHPASSVGDCGAAAGLLQLAWIEQAFARGYAPGTVALAHSGSAGGARAAAVFSGSRKGPRR